MNACKSTSISESGDKFEHSIAQALIQNGIDVVVGMSYDISQGAAEKFVGQFYRELLVNNQSLAVSASSSRAYLFKNRERNARFGLLVEVDDWIVPCLYARNSLRFRRSRNAKQPWNERLGSLTSSLPRVPGFFSGSLFSIDRVRRRFQMLFNNENDELDVLIGRDMDIYKLENLFLLPLLPKDAQERRAPLYRRIVHVHGWAGIGKTAMLHHLMKWWKATHLVEDSIYCDFSKLLTMEDVQNEIKRSLLGGSENASSLNMNAITRTLQTKRYLLVLDHLETIYLNARIDFLQQLASFLGALASGQSYVITASRNRDEGWFGLSQGSIWRLSLDGIPSQAAVQLIKGKSGLNENSLPQIRSRDETEALLTLVDWCERTPAALVWVGDYIRETNLLPSALIRMIRAGEAPSAMLQKSSRLNQQINEYFSGLTAQVAKLDRNSLIRFSLITSLAAFRKRIPADLEILYLFTNWKGSEGTPWDFQTQFGVQTM